MIQHFWFSTYKNVFLIAFYFNSNNAVVSGIVLRNERYIKCIKWFSKSLLKADLKYDVISVDHYHVNDIHR